MKQESGNGGHGDETGSETGGEKGSDTVTMEGNIKTPEEGLALFELVHRLISYGLTEEMTADMMMGMATSGMMTSEMMDTMANDMNGNMNIDMMMMTGDNSFTETANGRKVVETSCGEIDYIDLTNSPFNKLQLEAHN